MEVEFSLTKDDLVAYAEHQLLPQWLRQKKKAVYKSAFSAAVIVIATVIGLTWGLFDQRRPKGPGLKQVLPVIIPIALVVWLLAVLVSLPRRPSRRLVRKKVERLLRQPMADRILWPQRIAISPTHLTRSSGDSAGQIAWNDIYKIENTDTHVYFFTDPREAIVVPSHAFSWDHEFREFVETASRYHREATAHSDGGGS